MELRRLGASDLRVSVVGLGCNNFGGRIDFAQTVKVVDRAIERGVNFFDTADIYGGAGKSEEFLGRTLGSARKDIVLATKFGNPMDDSGHREGAGAAYIKAAVEDSLRRLKTDYIDLYQLHTPDPKTSIEETLVALSGLVKAGKVRYIGCSNLPAWEVVDSIWISGTKDLSGFVSCQDEYSLLKREAEKDLIPVAERFDLGILPYFPLASGLLTGKYEHDKPLPEGTRFANSKGLADRYMTEQNWMRVQGLDKFAKGKGHTLLELAFCWLLSKPVVSSVIAGATRPEQVEQNVSAANWELTDEELAEVDKILAH